MFPRLEIVEEMEEEKRNSEKADFRWAEFLRNLYYKHYNKWSVLTICVFLGIKIHRLLIKQKIFLPAIGGVLLVLSQWSQHCELLGLLFLIVGVSLSVLRCCLHYASLSQRRRVLPYIGWVSQAYCEG